MTDTDTTTLLSTALENEAKLLLKLIGELENEDLFEFTRVLAAAQPQSGVASHYRRRKLADSKLDPERSLAEQFNLLRVVENSAIQPSSMGLWGDTC